jgi:hypothetical protein
MVAVQESAPRQQLKVQAAARVMGESLKANIELSYPTNLFPFDAAKRESATDLTKAMSSGSTIKLWFWSRLAC